MTLRWFSQMAKPRRRTSRRLITSVEALQDRVLLSADAFIDPASSAVEIGIAPAAEVAVVDSQSQNAAETSPGADVGDDTPKPKEESTPTEPSGDASGTDTAEPDATPNYPEGGDDDVVAIFDNDDGDRPDGIADSEDFQEAADDYDNIGASDWNDAVQQLEQYVEENGLIDVLYIFDHGTTYVDTDGNPTGDHTQQFGDEALTTDMIDDIAHLLSDDAVIIIAGCNVAQDDEYVQSLADASDATVIASDANVQYDPEWFDDDFQSQGDWEVFVPDGEETTISPSDLGLDEVDVAPGNGTEDKDDKKADDSQVATAS